MLFILREHVLYAKQSKCYFGLKEAEYLGDIISGSGVAMDKDKEQAILQWPRPVNVKQFRGFLGLTGYYRKFDKGNATIAAPLTNLLKKRVSIGLWRLRQPLTN